MRTTIVIVTSLLFMGALGCGIPPGGGMSSGDGFNIAVPASDVQVRQGETQDATVSLHRGQKFKRDVTLIFIPTKGISLGPAEAVVKAGEKPDVHLLIMVPKDADLGEYKVSVRCTPQTGEATSTEFTVNVVSRQTVAAEPVARNGA